MFSYITLSLSLVALAAIWPPYNVYIADALGRKDRITVALIVVAAVLGLSVSSFLVAAGASLTKLPLGKIGGAFVVFTGVRLLLSKAPAREESVGKAVRSREAVAASFLISATPGVYAVTVAHGIAKNDLLQALAAFIGGPLGILLGGILLSAGLRMFALPVEKIGGSIVLAIGAWMIIG
ncbi:MAG: hypothetical protein ACYC1U_06245 [Candidatus Aquicultorales bacterium]